MNTIHFTTDNHLQQYFQNAKSVWTFFTSFQLFLLKNKNNHDIDTGMALFQDHLSETSFLTNSGSVCRTTTLPRQTVTSLSSIRPGTLPTKQCLTMLHNGSKKALVSPSCQNKPKWICRGYAKIYQGNVCQCQPLARHDIYRHKVIIIMNEICRRVFIDLSF